MTSRKSKKQIITEIVLTEIRKRHNIYNDSTIEELVFDWWMTGHRDGLRLTDKGVSAFQLAELAYYDYSFEQSGQSWYSFVLETNKKINCPYYLGLNKSTKKAYIRFYDSKIAMMVGLYGTLQEYLNSIKVKHD